MNPKQIQWISILEILLIRLDRHEVTGSIPGTFHNFKCGLGLERGLPRLVRTIG